MNNIAFNTGKTLNHSTQITQTSQSSEQKKPLVTAIAKEILAEIMKFRRVPAWSQPCPVLECEKCYSQHLPAVILAVQANQPIRFILPAFPGKSPNLQKVLGVLPDYAERLALNFLGSLCLRIKKIYPPGIKIILCSDGRVFNDVVGIQEENITTYQMELNQLIDDLLIADISIFNLDNFYTARSFNQMREALITDYAQSLQAVKDKIQNGAKAFFTQEQREAHQIYCGITRFLFEDSLHPHQPKSRTTIQKESRVKAYELIRRTEAWGALIAEHFPHAIRLSIHPQICGSKKLGIRLIGNELWMTPWHGVAIEMPEGFALLKRNDAEALGAQLIYSTDGRPSHYQLQSTKT